MAWIDRKGVLQFWCGDKSRWRCMDSSQMNKVSAKVHFIKTLHHKPLCGRSRNVAIGSTVWKEVTCARCRRVIEHKAKLQRERNKNGLD